MMMKAHSTHIDPQASNRARAEPLQIPVPVQSSTLATPAHNENFYDSDGDCEMTREQYSTGSEGDSHERLPSIPPVQLPSQVQARQLQSELALQQQA